VGKLRVLSGREVCAILASNGFLEIRRRGSHILMQKRTDELYDNGTRTSPSRNQDRNSPVDYKAIQGVTIRVRGVAYALFTARLQRDGIRLEFVACSR
jgi:hypothetical protein